MNPKTHIVRSRARHITFTAAAFFLLAGLGASTARAAILWSAPGNITSDTDVSLSGNLVAADSVQGPGGGNVTVNGVGFSPFGLPQNPFNTSPQTDPTGYFTATPAAGTAMFGVALQVSNNSPYATLPGYYTTLLGSAGTDSTPGAAFTLSINGLTPGHQYLFQWWTEDSNNSLHSTITASDGTAVSLIGNTSDTAGGLGQYALGTFIAGASPESIVFSGTNYEYVNAYQLRDITPEPSSAVLLAATGASALLRRRPNGEGRGLRTD